MRRICVIISSLFEAIRSIKMKLWVFFSVICDFFELFLSFPVFSFTIFNILVFYVTQSTAEFPVNLKRGEKTVGGELSNDDWYDYEEKILTIWIYTDNGINDQKFTIAVERNESVKGLDMQHNHLIEFLPVEVAEIFPNIMAYNAYNCSVKALSSDNFRNLKKIDLLDLSFNEIEFIKSGFFDDLEVLRILKLFSNEIYHVGQNAFKNLKNLQTLYLGKNDLKTIEFDIDTLVELRNFSMPHNQLSILHEKLFENNKKLEIVWFDNNKIHTIAATFFDDLEHLRYVDFKNNTCMNSHFWAGEIDAMKEEIKDDCRKEWTLGYFLLKKQL